MHQGSLRRLPTVNPVALRLLSTATVKGGDLQGIDTPVMKSAEFVIRHVPWPGTFSSSLNVDSGKA